MTTITDFVRRQLDTWEATATAATGDDWYWHGSGWDRGQTLAAPGPLMGEVIAGLPRMRAHELNVLKTTSDWPPTDADAAHIALHDPTSVLATVTALRAIVALHDDAGASQGYGDFPGGYGMHPHCCASCGSFGEYGEPWPCPTIRAVASIWASADGWDPAWTVTG